MLRGEFVIGGKRGGYKANPCRVNWRAIRGSGIKGSGGVGAGDFLGHAPP